MIRHAVVPAYLLACLLLGGASAAGFIANFVLQIASLPLIGWALWQMMQERPSAQIRAPLSMLAIFVVIALLQLVPLPPALWTLLPGRGAVVEGYRLLGIPLPWLPLTLAPDVAPSSILWLLPAFATLLGIVVLGAFRGRGIATAIVAVTLASVAIGALQVIGGTSAYLYRITNYGVAVGFFANANHNATLLLVCIPFLAALQATALRRSGSQRSASAIRLLVGAAYAVIFVGLLINSSLAGIGLSVPVALGSWLAFGYQRPALRRGIVVAAVAVSLTAVVTIVVGPFGNNLFGTQKSNVELSRQTSFALTFRAARAYFPIGSGTGSFQPVYHTQEPLSSVTTTFMNHAHSDWLELLLETGIVGVAFAALFLAWWIIRVRAIWRADEPDAFAQAAVIATAAIMMHSVVDYPLRTAALSAVFAACIGLMSGVRPYTQRSRQPSSARHLTL
ncbi:O-antigen ligase family protein [Sphingomonas sp. CFBP 13603]|uniref:O-antigen ligase family protein n=1 Tax=Sphingomonas sp. CFBP 13603 TaxID=2774040 RepID=UPI0018661B51|nr:O-antigen ligase family protein [Sphingomonas sp. CFBP 13603]MBE2992962.1 O-antigen ligase family protein [Sphingomonas sp. CFBP 13603]